MHPSHVAQFYPQLSQRFKSIISSSLDSDLIKTAVFYAEKYYTVNQTDHEARHLYATVLLRANQPFSALHLVNLPKDGRCRACYEIEARCCAVLGRHRRAKEALEESMKEQAVPFSPSAPRSSAAFPDKAALYCRSGHAAVKGNQHDEAAKRFREALGLNNLLWEAFDGLCYLGVTPSIDDVFPPKPLPRKRGPGDEDDFKSRAPSIASSNNSGFFTPTQGNGSNPFQNGWRAENEPPPKLGRMFPPLRDSIAVNDSFYNLDHSFLQTSRPSSNPTALPASLVTPVPAAPGAGTSRPLSSADEAGPAPKKPRSNARGAMSQAMEALTSKTGTHKQAPLAPPPPPSRAAGEDHKKPRTRTGGLNFPSLFSGKAPLATKSGIAKPEQPALGTRRSTRLLTGHGNKPSKQPLGNNRRRPNTQALTESEPDDDDNMAVGGGIIEGVLAVTIPSRSESPQPPGWTAAQEEAAQEEYLLALADQYIYDLVRQCAAAVKALSTYDANGCLTELEKLPYIHQQSAWAVSLVARSHMHSAQYELSERAFNSLRLIQPYRLQDMDAFSSVLWQLQRDVPLSFLAQELIDIDSRAPEAWIAIGNLFSLQRDRQQALTCFRHATDIDPANAYAWTLGGQETLEEDAMQAVPFFEKALRVDARHYNAWYGLGTSYLRQDQMRLAEYHYRRACDIHPHSSVLKGCVGVALEHRGDYLEALDEFDEAIALDPSNLLARFRRGKLFITLKRYQEAIIDLEFLHRTSADEHNVIFQLARVYRLAGQTNKAAQMLAVARDANPTSLGKLRRITSTMPDDGAEEDEEGGDEEDGEEEEDEVTVDHSMDQE